MAPIEIVESDDGYPPETKITNETVIIDGMDFSEHIVKDSTLVYTGGEAFNLGLHSSFSGSPIVFAGAAANTLDCIRYLVKTWGGGNAEWTLKNLLTLTEHRSEQNELPQSEE